MKMRFRRLKKWKNVSLWKKFNKKVFFKNVWSAKADCEFTHILIIFTSLRLSETRFLSKKFNYLFIFQLLSFLIILFIFPSIVRFYNCVRWLCIKFIRKDRVKITQKGPRSSVLKRPTIPEGGPQKGPWSCPPLPINAAKLQTPSEKAPVRNKNIYCRRESNIRLCKLKNYKSILKYEYFSVNINIHISLTYELFGNNVCIGPVESSVSPAVDIMIQC